MGQSIKNIAIGIFIIAAMAFNVMPMGGLDGYEYHKDTINYKIEKCGGLDRWNVKIVSDSVAYQINFKPVRATIKKMRSLPVDRKIGDKTPRFGVEFKTYTIKCKIREFKIEDDGDYHLVLVDPKDTTQTMVAEIVDPACDRVRPSKIYPQLDSVRQMFNSKKISRKRVTDGYYTITGVAFFDRVHGQLGVAPNGIELHPVIRITYSKK